MSQAIQVKYFPATNTKPIRLKAVCYGGSVTRGKSYYDDCEGNTGDEMAVSEKAAWHLVEKMGWEHVKDLKGGCLPNGDYCFVLVF